MIDKLSITLAQLNAYVGDIARNSANILSAYEDAASSGVDLLLTPELSVIGYPPEDLVLKPFFQRQARAAVEELAFKTAGQDCGMIVGSCWLREDGALMNASILLADGDIRAIRYKHDLPNYGVFDEKRVFTSGDLPTPMLFKGVKLGVMICEDMWFADSAGHLADQGADMLLVPTCSPFNDSKLDQRLVEARARVSETGLPLLFCNQIGGQDELVFDGNSFVLAKDGSIRVSLAAFEEEKLNTYCLKTTDGWQCETSFVRPAQDRMKELYSALVLGLRDYVAKNGFPGVVLGMSGGIDSAISCAIAADALGPDRVRAIMLPSEYTSEESLQDAEACAAALGVHYERISIEQGVDAIGHTLEGVFAGKEADITEENIQSRLRGLLLMAISNKFGHMVLTTGNKSEVSVGYATLYGDMCGGYNAIKDVYKTDVFALCRWRNENCPDIGAGPNGNVIPERIITKPPTAELRPDQKDEDSLPPYDRLDAILRGLIEDERAVADLVADGFDKDEVARVEHLLYIAEYKRRQAAPGAKLTTKNFGRDRRYPITNGFRSARYDQR